MTYHLKLTKGRSYKGAVSATKSSPDVYVYDQAIAEKAVASGFFTLVEETDEDAESASDETAEESADTTAEDEEEETGKTLEQMTRGELEAFAAVKGVSLKGLTKKADYIAKLREELPEEEVSGVIQYGSPTMMELED